MAGEVIKFTILGIDKFSGAMKKVSASIKAIGKTALRATKWAAGLSAALIAFTKVMAAGQDAAAKFAKRIGVAVEQLSAMQYAAGLANISTEQFNMAVQRMTRRVAEAAKGMGEAKGALTELGINAREFQNLGLDEQMATLADRMKEVEDPAQRLRLAFKLFDSEGTAVLQMLGEGSEAMREAAKDAAFLGLVISKQAAANAEHFQDSMSRATGSIKGLGRGIANELIPVMSGLANRFANAVAEARPAIVNFVKQAIVNFFTLVEAVKQVFAGIGKIFSDTKAFSNFLDNLGAFIKAVGAMFVAMMVAVAKIMWEGIKAMTKIWSGFFSWVGGAIFDLTHGKEVQDFSDTMAQVVSDAVKEAASNLGEGLKSPMEVFKSAAKDAGSAILDSVGVNLDLAREKAEATISSLMEFGEVVKEQITTTGETMSELMIALDEQSKIWIQGLQENATTFAESFFNLMDQTVDAISNGIGTAIATGQSMAKIFQQIGQQVLASLIAMFVKLGIQRLILSAVTKSAVQAEAASDMAKASAATYGNAFASTAAIPIVGPSLAPGVAAASTAAMQAGAAASAATGAALGAGIAGARAEGGPVLGGRTYLVGEKGPELFTPGLSGGITPNSGVVGSSVTIENVQIDVLPNATNAEALLSMDKKELEEIVAGPIIDALDALSRKGIKPLFAGD